MPEAPKKVMITVRKAPHGTIYVQEAIEVMFIVASYGMDLTVVFIDDGVLALKGGQDTSELGVKGFMASLGALTDFEVTRVYADRQSLTDRNLSEDDLVFIGEDEETEELVKARIASSETISKMMAEQDSIMSL
ncbi:MAG: sulfurtransferase complex subunit TusC [Gammaproteobacteria bacterium]|nr:MAG: sulfurtransferase complex subunit TusC [Gammaproteobacteria bacterium]